jgi:nitroimidazol reductase NimA-like FMN-containing flavoprotein (pyridoxamine 5'-phosphate oxidase superfamily)
VIGELRHLGADECRSLLGSQRRGRVAFASHGVPLVLPVNYLYEHPHVVVRTGPGPLLDDVPLAVVAFEIDGADDDGAWGWSVVVEGPAIDITESTDSADRALRRLPLLPWAPGARHHWLKIVAGKVTGRSYGIVPVAGA